LLIFVRYVHVVFELSFYNIKLPRFIEQSDNWSYM
jgi:hypothetical protein